MQVKENEQCGNCYSYDVKRDPDFPDTMWNCNNCGMEWNEDGEVLLNPNEI